MTDGSIYRAVAFSAQNEGVHARSVTLIATASVGRITPVLGTGNDPLKIAEMNGAASENSCRAAVTTIRSRVSDPRECRACLRSAANWPHGRRAGWEYQHIRQRGTRHLPRQR